MKLQDFDNDEDKIFADKLKQKDWNETYKNIPEFCKSVHFDQLKDNKYSLVPSKYIDF